jgi:Domain of unknown function (DUF4837)
MKKFFLFVISIISVFYFISCEIAQRPAQGHEDEIYVVADSSEFADLSFALDSTFEKIIYTPQPEKLFTLIRISPKEIDIYKQKKNILIAAPLNSHSYTSQYIHSVVDSNALQKIKTGGDFIIRRDNLWAGNQLVMILTAPTIQELEFDILKDKDNLLYTFQKVSDDRLKASLYNAHYENEALEGKLLKEYGWIVYVQADFKLALDIPKDNFVWLRRSPGSDMERWLFVHWIDNASPAYLNEDSIRAIRNRMTKKYYRTVDDSSYVVIASDYYTSNEVNFNGRYAICTQGLWELNVKGMGGPFINYTFFDEKTNRLYMLDGSVYAPKYYKRNLIQQMDVLLQSFMTEGELSKDRRQDLLNAAKKAEKK